MRRVIPTIILIIGICLSIGTMLVLAQDDDEAAEPAEETVIELSGEFIGSRECRDCHRDISSAHADTAHALTMVEIEEDMDEDENPVVADFEAGEDVRMVTFPDGETRAFTLEDVAFNLGAGRNVQAFIYQTEVDDEDVFYVFPAEWNVSQGAWQATALAEAWPDDAYAFGPNCAGCHTVGVDVDDYDWEEEGVRCESCHGPGLDHVEFVDDAGREIDEEERAEIYASINVGYGAATCGQCHIRGISTDGVHPYPAGHYPTINNLDDLYEPVATDDEGHWWPSGHAELPNMQYNEYLTSSHTNALATAQASDAFSLECLTCHSTTQQFIDLRLNNQDLDPETIDPMALLDENAFGVTCASCHDPHKVTDDDDEDEDAEMVALPALMAEENYTLCVSCHSNNDVTDGIHHPVREVFEGIAIIDDIEVTASPHFTAEDGPMCTTCHMPAIETYNGTRNSHTFQIVSPGSVIDVEGLQDTCSRCHDGGPAELQSLIDDLQGDTQQRINTAREALADDTEPWVRTALDVVENEGSFGIHNFAYTSELLNNVELTLGLQESAAMSEADVSTLVDSTLPDVEPVSTIPDTPPNIAEEGLSGVSIAILIVAGLILLAGTLYFFRSEN